MKRKTAKKILAETFREIAGIKPIDKITVKDITEACGYSSATFYRQFQDKYDLIAWAYTEDLENIMDRIEYDKFSWLQALTEAARYYYEHRDYLGNLLIHTSGYDSFVRNMTEINYTSLKERILSTEGIKKLDKLTDMLLRIYIHGSVRFTCEWILGRYDIGLEELVEAYNLSLPYPLRKYLCPE
ncbi:TetR family transcriptional regulator [bacterium]|nr:TetR family transcriptional regulator [bacterium]